MLNDGKMGALACAHRRGQSVDVEAEHVTTEEQEGAQRLVLRAGRDALSHGQVGQVVADDARVDVRVALLVPLGRVPEEALDPADVGAFRSIGAVAGSQPRSEFTENRQWLGAASRAGHSAVWQPAPVGSAERVGEVDPYRLLRLAYLPVLVAAGALQFLAEPP
jgi:hypothetical protein